MSYKFTATSDTKHFVNLDGDVPPVVDYHSFLSIVTNIVPSGFTLVSTEPTRVTYRHIVVFKKGNQAQMSFVMCGDTFSCEHLDFSNETYTGTAKYYILEG